VRRIAYLVTVLLLVACGGPPQGDGAIWDSSKWDQSRWQ